MRALLARLRILRLARSLGLAMNALVWLLFGAGAPGGETPSARVLPPPPNVVVVMADDLGYGDLGCFGGQVIATPRLDALAAEGARLPSFYAQSICTPTRAAFLTGRHARRLEMNGAIGPWSPLGLDPSEVTIAETLGIAGYRSGVFGKWHVGDSPDQLPTAQGFDEFVGLPWGPTGIPTIEMDSRHGSVAYEPDPRTQTRRATDDALDFIDRTRAQAPDDPFFCLVAYVAPHDPAASRSEFLGQSADGRDYGDAVEELDAEIGRLVDEIDARGLGGDTLVLFLSDNGAKVTGDPYENGSNGPLSGGKGTTMEGGIRVPAIARWTGVIAPGGEVADPMHVVDVLPTLAALGRAPLPARVLDGIDVTGALLFGRPLPQDRMLFFSEGSSFNAVRRGPFKLREGALFDVVSDPGETQDLAPGASGLLLAELNALGAALAAAEAEAEADPAARAPSSRWRAQWLPVLGPSAPGHLSNWEASGLAPASLTLGDEDTSVDVVTVPPPTGFVGSYGAYGISSLSRKIRWTGALAGLDPTGPFTVALRHRAPAGLVEPLCLLDVGDESAGLSITLGDGGKLGDDAAPGCFDDLHVVAGGQSVIVDVPDGRDGVHVAVVRGVDGMLRVYIDGEGVGEAPVGAADVGLAADWSLGAPLGQLGGASATSGPFGVTATGGTFGELLVVARPMPPNEVALERCRYLETSMCFAALNSTGVDARLDVGGLLRRQDAAAQLRVTRAPPGEIAVAMAAADLARTPMGDGYLCLGSGLTTYSAWPAVVGPDGAVVLHVPDLYANPLGAPGAPIHLQVMFDDVDAAGAATTNTTNVVRLIWCPL